MIRAAAYCRVSTDQRDQVNSFVSQKLFFQQYIDGKTGWSLFEIYADEGITGTTTSDRTGFLKMIDDAHAGRFDMILTKEVSRFSRNLLDAVAYTRELKQIGVAVIFLNDGISTLDPDAELRLGIMASVAQEESRKTSERVKWGQQRKMERGVVFGRSLLGYDVRAGTITVEPTGAEVVRNIYDMYLRERNGVRAIADTLTRRGTATKNGSFVWSGATVLKILKNEKYCGDLMQRKTVTTDFLTHKKTKNNDDADFIYIRDHHEPLVSREAWEEVQKELARRSSRFPTASHGSRYALSGKIVCAGCRAVFLCRTRKRKDGTSYRVWNCRCGCSIKHHQIREEAIDKCVRGFIATSDKYLLLHGLDSILARAAGSTEAAIEALKSEIANNAKKSIRLADIYIAGDIDREAYLELKNTYEINMQRLKDKLQQYIDSLHDDDAAALNNIMSLIASGKDCDSELYLSLIDRVEVHDDGSIDICCRNLNEKFHAFFIK